MDQFGKNGDVIVCNESAHSIFHGQETDDSGLFVFANQIWPKHSEVVQTVAAATFKVNTLLRFHLELKTCVLSVFTLQAAAGFILSILQTTYLEKIRTATRWPTSLRLLSLHWCGSHWVSFSSAVVASACWSAAGLCVLDVTWYPTEAVSMVQ